MKTLREMILVEHSKEQRDKIVDWVGESQIRFDRLMELFLGKEVKVVQRAAWALRSIGTIHPEWTQPHIASILSVMQNPVHDAVLRNGFLILEPLDFSEEALGYLAELSFEVLGDSQMPTAIKRGALLNLIKIAEQEPDLIPEIIAVLKFEIPHSTIGFVNLAKRIIKQFQ